ncbi:MAG: ABC transporter permease [Anaerolineae bacterium]|nr:ABC transporter permease [Anaerolineae bacterium]
MRRARTIVTFLGRIEGLPIALVLVALYIVFILTAPRVFLGYRIYMSFLQTVPPVLVCALGLTFVITAGEIDLSFPAIVAASGFVFAWMFKTFDAPWAIWIGFVLALAVGALIGYINGWLIAKIGVPSIMATLAAQFFWYGVTILLAGGLQLDISGIRGSIPHSLFVGRLFDVVPVQALWGLALAAFLWFILNRHAFGEAILFIGDNPEVARVMGVNVEATRIKLFTMNGVIAAFAGLLLTMEINVFFPTQGQGFLLPALASVFIGGTSIAGGQGTIVGTFFGAYIIGSLEAGVVASRISGYWVQLVQGVVMAAVVILNIVIGEGRVARLSDRIRHWIMPARLSSAAELPRTDAQR